MPSILNATTTSGLVTSADNSGSLQLQTNNGTTAVTIDTSQNVGIGTSSPNALLNIQKSDVSGFTANTSYDFLVVENGTSATGAVIQIVAATNGVSEIGFSDSTRNMGLVGYSHSSNAMYFFANETERMRITSGGNLLVGYTTAGNSTAGVIGAVGYNTKAGQSGSLGGNMFNINWTGSPQLWIDTTNLGTIQLASDYRIKRNVETQTAPALERVMQLRPVTYQMADYGDLFKASDEIKEGFIAHEVQEVIPSGADGEKDAENQIQSLRVDAILSVAVKAIQELKAELDEVKAELDATKAEVQALKGVA